MKPLMVFLTLLLFSLELSAQDPDFSQPFAAPLYYNPAFAGTAELARINGTYHNQWSSISSGNQTFNLSYDQQIFMLSGGVGLFATYNQIASGVKSATAIGAVYNYRLQVTRNLYFRVGVKGSFNDRAIDLSKVKWGQDIPGDPSSKFHERYGDFGGGLLVYGDQFYAGFSTDHLFEPTSIIAPPENFWKADRKFVVQGGYFRKLTSEAKGWILNPSIIMLKQGSIYQAWPGINLHKGLVAGGISYRAIRTNPEIIFMESDALNFLIGFQKRRFKISYVYEYTFPDPKSAAVGSHELFLGFFLGTETCCHKFYSRGYKKFQKMF